MIELNILKSRRNSTCCIFIRHAEKNTNSYNLSDIGKQESLKFAEKLCLLNKKINIFSSPEARCVETATIINNKVNGQNSNIYISHILGKPGVQVKNKEEYSKLTDTMRCRDIFNEWKNGGCFEAMHTPEIIKKEIITFFNETSLENNIVLYISQSGTVACTGYSLNLIDYKVVDDEWVKYLDGYIFWL